MEYKKKMKRKKQILSWLLIAVMLLTGMNVQASVFDDSSEDIETFQADSTGASTIKIVFADKNGNIYSSLTTAAAMGSSITLPGVPGYESVAGSGWKLDPNIADSEAVVLPAKSTFTLNSSEGYVTEHIQNDELILYAVDGTCTVNFYNNSGTGNPLKTMKVAAGTMIKLPDIPNSSYVNFGWTTAAKSTSVKYKIGASYAVNNDTNLYLVRYAKSKVKTVTFLETSGASSSSFQALTMKVVVTGSGGTRIKLPSVPSKTGYTSLGWSTKKNASTAAYAAGKTITVTKNLTLYAVRRKLPSYSVKFNNNSGTSTSKTYTSLTQKVYRGSYVTLPAVPKASGYQNLGWTTVKKGKTVQYKAGDKVKVTANMTFYAVRKKNVYYTVSFYSSTGTAGSVFKSLNKKVVSGSSITLPSVPSRSGYVGIGWSTKKNASSASYKAGDKLKISKNVSLYAVYKKAATVILHKKSGAVYKTYTLAEGSSFTLPGVKNAAGYTMMGWSKYSGKSVKQEYEVGEKLTNIRGTVKLYAVVFDRRTEPDYSASELPQVNLQAYKQVIFVGDSRTNRMSNTLNTPGNAGVTNGITFISKEGEGLTWLQNEGYAKILKQVGNDSTGLLSKKTLVIFNLGVNDLSNGYSYVTYMRSIAAELQKRNCVLYYMSVNPINNEMIKAYGQNKTRLESDVRNFNKIIKTNLCSGSSPMYKYIDTYSYLMQTGFGTDRNRSGEDEGIDDGLHYTVKTYKRIYKYCMDVINRGNF